jgi:chaperone required for assembly of F1-ATPase
MSEDEGDGRRKQVIPTKDSMRAPLPRRFYEHVSVAETAGGADGWRILLDGRGVKTTAKRDFALPTRALAEAVAAEWAAQAKEIDPASMPVTRIVNSALDGVASQRDEVAADIVTFSGSDLLCYRADAPDGLVRAQAAHWDPVLAWAEAEIGAKFTRTVGIVHVAQPKAACAAIARAVKPYQPVPLAALHVMTTLTGSALLALAHACGRLTVEEAWAAAHVDEDWQISQWGEDHEAVARRALRWVEMQAAARVLALSQ